MALTKRISGWKKLTALVLSLVLNASIIGVGSLHSTTLVYADPLPPSICDLEGTKYTGSTPTANVVIGVAGLPTIVPDDGETATHTVRSFMVMTKTDEAGHYCFTDLPAGTLQVFEMLPAGTTLDHVMSDSAPTPTSPFSGVFTPLDIIVATDTDLFYDFSYTLNNATATPVASFLELFTESALGVTAPEPATLGAFFGDYVLLGFSGDTVTLDGHVVDFYNALNPAPVSPPPQVVGSVPPQCADGADNDGNGGADFGNDTGCESSLDTNESGGVPIPHSEWKGDPKEEERRTGEVLGATTEPDLPLPPECAANPYLRDYMKMNKQNDPEQVKLLQSFLNETLEAGLPVEGDYGYRTKMAVKAFQRKNHADILQPWIDAGFETKYLREGTGVVYKTTKRHINMVKCAALQLPMPELRGDTGLIN